MKQSALSLDRTGPFMYRVEALEDIDEPSVNRVVLPDTGIAAPSTYKLRFPETCT